MKRLTGSEIIGILKRGPLLTKWENRLARDCKEYRRTLIRITLCRQGNGRNFASLQRYAHKALGLPTQKRTRPRNR